MGYDLYQNSAAAKEVFEQADKALGFPLSRICFEGPEDELRQTNNAQPAILTVSYAAFRAIQEMDNHFPSPSWVSGHSLGEYTALAVAGVVDFTTVLRLAQQRGRLMYEAGLEKPGGMVAVLGFDEALLAEVCQQTGTWMANINCPGQLVISGAKEDLTKAVALAKAKGARRLIPLAVSGAFHTPLMQPAVQGMTEILDTSTFNDPVIPIVANTTAQPMTTAGEVKAELLRQLCQGIRWQRSIEYMVGEGVTTFIEVGPGQVLSGLIRRINSEVKAISIGDTPAIRDFSG